MLIRQLGKLRYIILFNDNSVDLFTVGHFTAHKAFADVSLTFFIAFGILLQWQQFVLKHCA